MKVSDVMTADVMTGERIERALTRCGYGEPDHKVTVSVRKGVVHLGGRVLHEIDIRLVGALVTELDGVVSVNNRVLYREADPAHVFGHTVES